MSSEAETATTACIQIFMGRALLTQQNFSITVSLPTLQGTSKKLSIALKYAVISRKPQFEKPC